MARRSVTSSVYGADRKGLKDSADAFDKALRLCDGDEVFATKGNYLLSRPIKPNSDKGYILQGEPGTNLIPMGDFPCIEPSVTTDTTTLKLIRMLNIVGSTRGDPKTPKLGKQIGIRIVGVPGESYSPYCTMIEMVSISGCSGPAIDLAHAYNSHIDRCLLRHNGAGVRNEGANATSISRCMIRYNATGVIDPHVLRDSNIEVNFGSGVVRTENHPRPNIECCYFEQNGLWNREVNEELNAPYADIDGGDPARPWSPVSQGVHGCEFNSSYESTEFDKAGRAVPTHNIRGQFYLLVSGNTRYFHSRGPWKQFDISGVVRDGAGTNDMASCPNGFDKTKVTYTRT